MLDLLVSEHSKLEIVASDGKFEILELVGLLTDDVLKEDKLLVKIIDDALAASEILDDSVLEVETLGNGLVDGVMLEENVAVATSEILEDNWLEVETLGNELVDGVMLEENVAVAWKRIALGETLADEE